MSKQALMMFEIVVLDIIGVVFSACLYIPCHVCLLYASLYRKVFV